MKSEKTDIKNLISTAKKVACLLFILKSIFPSAQNTIIASMCRFDLSVVSSPEAWGNVEMQIVTVTSKGLDVTFCFTRIFVVRVCFSFFSLM